MGMIFSARRLTGPELASLESDEENAAELLEDETEEGWLSGQTLDLDKAWDGVHYLLTAGGTLAGPLALAIAGGQPIGEDLGYGPARLLRPEEVQAIATAWATTEEDALRDRYDASSMTKNHIYPMVWDEAGVLDEYLMPSLRSLRDFYRQAAYANQTVLVGLL